MKHSLIYTLIIILLTHFQLSNTFTKSVTLTPQNLSSNGATITIHKDVGVTTMTNQWEIIPTNNYGFHLQIDLYSSWNFHPFRTSQIKLEIDKNKNDKSNDDLIITFNDNTSPNPQYFALFLEMDNSSITNDYNLIYPNPYSQTQEIQQMSTGNALNIINISDETYSDRVRKLSRDSLWSYFLPQTIGITSNIYPLTFELQKDPQNEQLTLLYTTTDPIQYAHYKYTHHSPLQILIAADDINETVHISSIKITYNDTTVETLNPTGSPSKSPTISSTKTPSVNPTVSPPKVIAKIPTIPPIMSTKFVIDPKLTSIKPDVTLSDSVQSQTSIMLDLSIFMIIFLVISLCIGVIIIVLCIIIIKQTNPQRQEFKIRNLNNLSTKKMQNCPTESVVDGFGSNVTPIPVVMPLASPCIHSQCDGDNMQLNTGTMVVEMGSFILNGNENALDGNPQSLMNTMINNLVISMDDTIEEIETPQGNEDEEQDDTDCEEYGESGSKINESVSNTALQIMDMTFRRINSATYDPEVIDENETETVTPTPFSDSIHKISDCI